MIESRIIEECIQKLSGTYLKDVVSIVLCTVESYDTNALTCDCTPVNDYSVSDIPGVQLSAGVSDGLVVFPTVGSNVYVALTTRNTAFLLLPSDIDMVQETFQINSTTWVKLIRSQSGIQLIASGSTNGIQLNDGSYGGIPIDSKILTNENAILTYVNAQMALIATALNAIVPGAGTPITTEIGSTPTMQSTQNPLITHGK